MEWEEVVTKDTKLISTYSVLKIAELIAINKALIEVLNENGINTDLFNKKVGKYLEESKYEVIKEIKDVDE